MNRNPYPYTYQKIYSNKKKKANTSGTTYIGQKTSRAPKVNGQTPPAQKYQCFSTGSGVWTNDLLRFSTRDPWRGRKKGKKGMGA